MITYPIEADGLTTRVHEAGTGDRNVLFMHGLGARADRWRQTVERYALHGYRCFAFDLPGHGFATKGNEPDYSVPGFARVARALMDKLSLPTTAIVGTSLGAHVAGHVALSEPSRIRGLVLVGAVGLAPIDEETRKAIRDSITRTERSDIEMKLKFVLADPGLVTDAWVEEEWRINTSPGASESFEALGRYFVDGIGKDEIGDRLAAITQRVPTCLVWGEDDRAVPVAVGEAVADILGDLALNLIPGAGHAPYFEQPAAFDAIALPFLDTLDWA
ncbi:alpha/beta fold hydrolase [Oceanibacterium hippocampi]|uniref:2-hydroxy-6-oxononadienedioate/2-hydroxy-6-oxononatrienedioate hydrolase n=1 Tax=Oceanibacterium hippocampi TaxID=745714 RepID=A0A1Y5TTH6_9PROT|nr:alpha/beta fold hydrolase [Oceanibacterium hippocampi]SLN72158.1 2-hydroxy-6-oxononadienedioate/2-hydroxy-6-oxononatrienedioate hydrolase [Oceanibacterium hippocampi]